MDTAPPIQISVRDEADAEVELRQPAVHFAVSDESGTNVEAQEPAMIAKPKTRASYVATEMLYKDVQHNLLIWSNVRLGSGGCSTVFQANLVAPGGAIEVVAVKAINLLRSTSPSGSTQPPEVTEQLLSREVAIWQRLDHPRILPFYGMTEQFGLDQFGLVSPLISNGDMITFIMKNPTKDRLRLVHQAAEGLEYLHQTAGLVHGDLKCANILISDDECALVADFGLSTFINGTGAPTLTGIRARHTAAFAAPELFSDEAFNKAVTDSSADGSLAVASAPNHKRSKTTFSDVFAFGSLIYEAFSCEEPWRGMTGMQLMTKVATTSDIPPRTVSNERAIPLTDVVWELCKKCWTKDPFQRPDCVSVCQILGNELSSTSGEVVSAAGILTP